ncbi:MAG: MotA/TolQ/ExbB proton channel family protein [Planctomycetes bacterium]|nr:MotA/TolQ/ExbB proton channel family protein [Planctomycetota bacterium]
MFIERSWVQYATVFLTSWSLATLLLKWLKLRLQARALSIRLVPDACDFVLSPVTAPQLLHNIHEAVDDPRHFLLLNRIVRSLGSLKNMGRVSDVDDVLRSQAENDEAYVESTLTLVHGFVWAIPVLGFIGTVLGLSDAIGSFGVIVSKGTDVAELRVGLQAVTGGLAIAFETTLVALVAALCIQLLLTLLKKRELEFLDACGDYCHAHIVSRVRILQLDQAAPPAGAGGPP